MSNNELPTTEIKNILKTLPLELQGKINYLIENPTAKVVKLSDPQRGSTSNQLFGLITNIDLVKPILTDVLNFKIDLKDHAKFFAQYADYGKNYKEAIELLKKLEKLGIDLLKFVENEQDIRNKRLRSRVFDKKAAAPKANAQVQTKKTPAQKTNTPNAKPVAKKVAVTNDAKSVTNDKDVKAIAEVAKADIKVEELATSLIAKTEEKADEKKVEVTTTKEEKK